MRVFVIIAVHNRKEQTLKCLKLLSEQTFKNLEIVLVDDGSSDGTEEIVKDLYPQIHIIKGDGNWWWARSMNEGFKYALNNKADILITLNNDVLFNSSLIDNLVQLHSHQPDAILGCLNTVLKEKEYIFFSGIKAIKWWKAKEEKYHQPFSSYQSDLNGLHLTYCLNGRGTLIPANVFKSVGFFDEVRFPQYAADYDFTLRARKKGISVMISWDIKIQSILESTGQGRTFIRQSWKKFLQSFTNRYSATSWRMWLNYYYKHAGWMIISGLPFQFIKLGYSFFKKRKQMEGIR
ncbi:glycosyltransferase family 2 protein [Carboxylicivirga linearis]|uniref:Glycosyltransferase family 2 protein n=1 Tax=Carboxylicivirga linearis TaxID=1628157 RepID=A0ABS5JW31_9BACT|nr:glycosyltransferase family 2 protein [Carboxylicivirga linearis]MBS2099107.1 glycosyltransferase family 2 protein [Carboxylicivirga linearis]